MSAFLPKLEILPAAQKRLWPVLDAVPSWFVLYGGTAMALRLGHRRSIDFDFFSSRTFQPEELAGFLPWITAKQALQWKPDCVTVVYRRVKVSFFGNLDLARVGRPQQATGSLVRVASLLDLLGCKLAVILKRGEAKDYRDIAAALHAGLTLSGGLAAAQAIYGNRFNPLLCLKALVYFEEPALKRLPGKIRKTLLEAVEKLEALPVIRASSVTVD